MQVFVADHWQAANLQDSHNGGNQPGSVDDAVGRILALRFKLFDQKPAPGTRQTVR